MRAALELAGHLGPREVKPRDHLGVGFRQLVLTQDLKECLLAVDHDADGVEFVVSEPRAFPEIDTKGDVLGRFLVHEGHFQTGTEYELIVQKDIVNPLKGQRGVIAHVRECAQVESRGRARLYTAV